MVAKKKAQTHHAELLMLYSVLTDVNCIDPMARATARELVKAMLAETALAKSSKAKKGA